MVECWMVEWCKLRDSSMISTYSEVKRDLPGLDTMIFMHKRFFRACIGRKTRESLLNKRVQMMDYYTILATEKGPTVGIHT